MRKDFQKVLCEHERGGSRYYRGLPNGYREAKKIKIKDSSDIDVVDEYGIHSSMMSKKTSVGYNGKERLYNYKLINKFLTKNLGRRWDDVYSDIVKFCKGCRGNHTGWNNIRRMFDVETNTYIDENGDIRFNTKYDGDLYISNYSGLFYVHPKTRVLCVSDSGESLSSVWRKRKKQDEINKQKTIKIISDTIQFHKIDNLWYRIIVGPIPANIYTDPFYLVKDVLGHLYQSYDQSRYIGINGMLEERYGRIVWGYKKLSASKAEIRKYNLI